MSETKTGGLLFLVKTGTISREDIQRAKDECGVTIIESSEPDEARFLEPPVSATIDDQASAALATIRMVVNADKSSWYPADIMRLFMRVLFESRAPKLVKKVPAR